MILQLNPTMPIIRVTEQRHPMSQTINPKAYLFEKSIEALFGFKPNYYAEHKDPERGYCVAFVAQQGHNLTFQQLNALSALLGTDEIDFSTGREGYWHSTRTFEDGSPPEFNCFNCKVK